MDREMCPSQVWKNEMNSKGLTEEGMPIRLFAIHLMPGIPTIFIRTPPCNFINSLVGSSSFDDSLPREELRYHEVADVLVGPV